MKTALPKYELLYVKSQKNFGQGAEFRLPAAGRHSLSAQLQRSDHTLKDISNEKNERIEKKASALGNSAIWLAASLSVPLATAGTAAAPLGAVRGTAAILLGCVAGGFLLFLTGLAGDSLGKNAMESSAISFGQAGPVFFAVLNVIQLTGWSALLIRRNAECAAGAADAMTSAAAAGAADVMTSAGAADAMTSAAAAGAAGTTFFGIISSPLLWILLTGGLILALIFFGLENTKKLCFPAAAVLIFLFFLLCAVSNKTENSFISFAGYRSGFGEVINLSASLPLFWIPVLPDHVSKAARPKRTSAVCAFSCSAAGAAACLVGMWTALRAGTADIAMILPYAGMAAAGLFLSVLGAVAPVFLCLYSAGVSFCAVYDKMDAKKNAVILGAAALLLAAFAPVAQLEPFLRYLTSAFLPMAAVLITDRFLTGRNNEEKDFDPRGCALWLFGFLASRFLDASGTPAGSALTSAVLLIAAGVAVDRIARRRKAKQCKMRSNEK